MLGNFIYRLLVTLFVRSAITLNLTEQSVLFWYRIAGRTAVSKVEQKPVFYTARGHQKADSYFITTQIPQALNNF